MNSKIVSLVATGAILAGCSTEKAFDESKLDAAKSGFQLFVNAYGCIDPQLIYIKVEDLNNYQSDVDKIIGGSVTGFTDVEGIHIEQNLPKNRIRTIATHEAFHACTDMNEITPLIKSYELEPGIILKGARGFRLNFNDSSVEFPDEFPVIEEGFAEWISQSIPGYETSLNPSYVAVRELTETIAKIANLEPKEIVELHKRDDVIGLIAQMKNVLPEQVTPLMITDIIFLYQDAFISGVVPSEDIIYTYLTYR